ncbi:MAG TPA: histidine phosphatase family protein, partial [Streptosporangiaceae bacterium]
MEGLPGDRAARAGRRRRCRPGPAGPRRAGTALNAPAPGHAADPWSPSGNTNVVTLILWRHGQTAFNAGRRFQGQTDVPLNAVGRRQAAVAARFLAALRPDAIFSS